MNICIINIRENNPCIGGVERVSYMLGHEWQQKGHNVICLSQYRSSIEKPYISQCEEFFLPDCNEVTSAENVNYSIALLEANDTDIIINQGSAFPKLCQLCKILRLHTGIKLVTTIHYAPLYRISHTENNFFIREKLEYGISKWIKDIGLYMRYHLYRKKQLIRKENDELSAIAAYSDAIVCLSKSFIPIFQSLLGSYSEKLVAIPNPVSLDNVPEIKKKKQIIYVGRLELGLKRVDRLVKIWAKTEDLFPDWSFRIVGDGDMRYLFERMARDKGLKHIYFDGFQDPDKYYAESSIICLSSSSEGFGMVLVEALKQQCIPIAYHSFSSLTDIIVNNVNGYCIPPFNEKKYLKKLHHLMSDEAERMRLAANHRLTLKRFDLETVSTQWQSLFKDIV